MHHHWLKGLALATSLALPCAAHADVRLQAVMKKLAAGEPLTASGGGPTIVLPPASAAVVTLD